jgi:nitrogen fixation NifU-like protein
MELSELYQETIIDHYRRPRNFGAPPAFTHRAEGFNPLCGDRVTVYLNIVDDVIQDVRFEGNGCAISTASASLMTEALKGKPASEAEPLFERMHALLTGSGEDQAPGIGKLAVLSGVRAFPTRIKCATLAWHTLHAALQDQGSQHNQTTPVSTE